MKEVVFLKAGNPYGYGYSSGEVGLVYETDQKRDTGAKNKDGKPIMQTIAQGFDWLQENSIVRTPTAADKKRAEEKAAAVPSRSSDDGNKAGDQK